MLNYAKESLVLQKTTPLALCLQHPAKILGFRFTFHVFERGKKQGSCEAVMESEYSMHFVTSQRADFQT